MSVLLRTALLITVWIAVAAATVFLGIRYQDKLGSFLCLGAILVPFAYIVICTLYPAWGDTKCPKCGKPALRRPNKKVMLGVVCDACGYKDPEMYRAYLDEMR